MKKILLWLSIILITNTITFVYASLNSVSIQEDFKNYLHKKALISEIEEEVTTLFESVTGEHYTNDKILYDTLTEEILPKYTLYQQKVNDISNRLYIKTKEVKKISGKYHHSVQSRLGAFQLLQASIEEQDEELKKQAYESLVEAEKLLNDYWDIIHSLDLSYSAG
ncbi:hypothetical protein [Chengkuizengella marina]|uniref:Uncharacterized protein n=1 Tax=Chengkuizengella marina TaxID=2507566 RepID=A0A6N9Q851_9BACL|nr:hypothetical protein [Chengkuizengella marina]NBI30989.1 hypothetical protein [Chengkuizengella marina]